MNWMWGGMMALAIVLLVSSGRPGEVLLAGLKGAQGGVNLALGLAAAYALWSGLLNLAQKAGGTQTLSRWIRPVVRRLLPNASKGAAAQHVAVNLSANMLGMGNAATPAGLEAIRLMADPSRPGVATDEICMLLIVNISSLQLIPTTIITMRMTAGAANPADIVVSTLLATAATTVSAVLFAKLFARWWKR